MTVLIRVLESRLRGNSPERFGRGERAKAPTYPYKTGYLMKLPERKIWHV